MGEEVKQQILIQEQPRIMLDTEECYSDSDDRHHRFGMNSLGSSLRSSLRGSSRRRQHLHQQQQQLHPDSVSSSISNHTNSTQQPRQFSLNSIFQPTTTTSNDQNLTGTTTATTISNAELSETWNDTTDSSLLGLSSLSLSLPTQPVANTSPATIVTTNTDIPTATDIEKVTTALTPSTATTEIESSTTSSLVPQQQQQQQPIVNLELSQQALDKILYDITLLPVDCSFGMVAERKHLSVSLKQMIRNERRSAGRADVMVMFAIRRPGCGACREHGKQLTELINSMNQQVQLNVGAVGIIKHINVDNNALLQFYGTYYKFPIYKDEKWCIYKKIIR